MNWTGGAKQRHSNGAGSSRHHQQQHFAKVKATILAGKKQSPRKHPDLDRLCELHEGSNRTRQPSVRFHARDDRHSSLRHANSFSPNALGEPYPSHSPAIQRHPAIAVKREKLSNHATPHGEKREYHHSASVASGGIEHEVEGSLFEKKRKILLKGDWVSVGFQRPPQVANVSSQNKQAVGRRRKVRDGHRPQYGNKQQSHLATKDHRHHRPPSREHHERTPRNTGIPGVKISIGGKVKAPGLSSSSAPRTTRSQSSHRILFSRQPSSSSEIMLLDNEGLRSRSISSKSLSGIQLANAIRATPEHQRQPLFCPSSASLVHPIPRSSKVAPILRSDSIDMDVAGSTIAQVGRSKPAVPSSEALDNGMWETWMEAMIPDSNTDSSIAQQNALISPGVSAAPTYGPTYNTTEASVVDYFDESSADLTPFGLPNLPVDLAGDNEETNLPDGHSTVGQSEGSGYFGETVETNAVSDILDDYSVGGEYTSGLVTQSLPGSSPISRRRFKLPSPLPKMASDEAGGSCSFVSLSPDRKSYTKSPISNQQHHNNQEIFEVTDQNDTGTLSNIAGKRAELPVVMEESAADDIWRQFVFGSDGEDIDIFGQQSAPSASNLGQPHGSSVIVQQSLSNSTSRETSPGERTSNTSRFFPIEQPTASLLEYRMSDDGSSYLEKDEKIYAMGARTDRATRGGSSSLTGSEELSPARPTLAASIRTASGDVTNVSTTQTDHRTFTITTSPVQRPKKKTVTFTKPTPFISSLIESSPEKEEILHIGKKNNVRKNDVKSNGASKRKREKGIY